MLSVGRELNISQRAVSCRACAWDGEGADLTTGLVPVACTGIFVYSYRCPACGSFNINRNGKLLQFRSPFAALEDIGEPVRPISGHTILRKREG